MAPACAAGCERPGRRSPCARDARRHARLARLLSARAPAASIEALVDARTGRVVRVRNLLRRATGTARIFDPNPVATRGSAAGLADNGDADSPLLTEARVPVTLDRLTEGRTASSATASTPIYGRARPVRPGATSQLSRGRTTASRR